MSIADKLSFTLGFIMILSFGGKYPERIMKPYEDLSEEKNIIASLNENQVGLYTPSPDTSGKDFHLFYPVIPSDASR